MAHFGLFRFVRSASALSKLIPRNDRLYSTCAKPMFFANIQPVSPPSSALISLSKISSRAAVPRLSTKIIPRMQTPGVLQCRAASTTGDHVRLWQIERIVSAAFIALLPGCIILQNPIVDGMFAILVVMHAHWGLEAVVVDYVRPAVVGPILPKVAFLALYLLSAMTLVGLLQLIYNGPGVGKTVRNLWAIGSEPPKHQ